MHWAWSRAIGIVGLGIGAATLPHRLCQAGAADWYEGAYEKQEALARGVARWLDEGAVGTAISTGSARFDSEWVFGTYQMAALGFGQMASEHPGSRAVQRARMERAIDLMLSEGGRRFDADAWGRDPLASLDRDEGHVAYLGYANLALGLHRSLWPDSRYAALNDAIAAALVRRYEKSALLLLETYPGEIYPLDNAAAIASIELHARARGREPPLLAREWSSVVRERYLHRETGLLYQAVDHGGDPSDAPRGSGTALAAYFLSFGSDPLSAELHGAVQRHLARDVLGFRAVREYPDLPGKSGGHGDIDSGPIVFGYGVSATGFSIAGCRIHGDRDGYGRTLATAQLFGAPLRRDGELGYVAGGPLGDAILFAMQTAQPGRG